MAARNIALALVACWTTHIACAQRLPGAEGYPKLLGMNIGGKNYDDRGYMDAMARLDIVIIGLYPGWRGDRDGSVMRKLVHELKRRNPSLKVGQYTILNEASDDRKGAAADRDKIDKLDSAGWWLLTAEGGKTRWSSAHGAWDINISQWARPDADGNRYPQWLAARDMRQFFARVPEFDIWYFDNVMFRSRVPRANWRLDGRNLPGTDPEVEAAFRSGMVAHWNAARALAPGVLQMGNVDNDLSLPEFKGQLQAAFLEAVMGKSWSLETFKGWRRTMDHYYAVESNLKPPKIIGFNVFGRTTDYAFFRFAFGSALLGNGHFSFTDEQAQYSSVPWFDEYDVRIGKPVEPPPTKEWSNGVYRRRYENALVLVNPEKESRTVALESGWKRFVGAQDPKINNGAPIGGNVVIPPRDGMLLVKQ